MWLGPVFQAEMMTLSRRRRFYLGRALYGLLVLLIVSSTYNSMVSSLSEGEEIPIARSARFGQAIFAAFATLQGIIVLVMTPSLVAGAIAEEKQRKTLHYLMASQLSSAEIILGKVAARLLRVAVLGAIGLPVLNMIALFGGVDFQAVLLVYGATATTTFFLAAVSILCSVVAVKPREAIMQAYFVELLWLAFAPIMLASMTVWSPFWQMIGEFCRPALEWLAASSPSNLLRGNFMMGSMIKLVESTFWMMGLQVAFGTVLLIVAAWRLRPAFRGIDGPSFWARIFRRSAQPQGRLRLWTRPTVSDDAMLWKEMHLHRVSDLRRIILVVLGLAVVGSVVYGAWDVGVGAVNEIRTNGYWGYGSNQQAIHDILAFVNAITIISILVGLGSISASSISSEREGDTWTNLASSPLDGVEVVRGKILGTLWLFRPMAYFLVTGWVFGIMIGAVHPVGVLISLVELAVFAWFVASLGVAISLRSKNTIQAMGLTIGILLFLNVGYLFIFVLLQSENRMMFLGCMPYVFTVGLLGMDQYRQSLSGTAMETFLASLFGTIFYAAAAIFLTVNTVLSYNRVVDRPDRFRSGLSAEKLQQILKVTTAEV